MIIDYKKFVDDAMLAVIKKILTQVQHDGLYGDHQLYISFQTNDPLVQLSSRIKKCYPNEITIVLEHQFDNLVVEPDRFSVGLSFDGIYELVKVPFRSITGFSDPSADFAIQFEISDAQIYEQPTNKLDIFYDSSEASPVDNVVELDKFRNKNRPNN